MHVENYNKGSDTKKYNNIGVKYEVMIRVN